MSLKTLDIVNVIEKNPITRLSQVYQNKLLNKIKEKFTDKEQTLFVSSFYCYLNYNSKNDFVIDLDKVWKWLGFSRKDHAKVVLKKNFVEDIDYKILLPKIQEQDKKEHGGNNKEQIMMNINTFKKFCLKSATKKADEIHDYYIKLEDLLHDVINEESDELRNQLTLKNTEIEKIKIDNKSKEKLNKHSLLLQKFKNKRCVYVAEIEENKFIKIGSTKDIIYRYNTLKRTYNNILFLDVFDSQSFREIESSILKEVKNNIYKKPINNHLSQEIVLLTNDFTYEHLMKIVDNNINKMYYLTPEQILEKEKLELEREKIEFEKFKLNNNLLMNIINNDKYKDDVKNILSDNLKNIFSDKINIENKNTIKDDKIIKDETQNPDYNMLYHFKIKGRKPKGRKIQKIDPLNLEKVIKVYDSMVYLLRSEENKGCQKSGIQAAIKKNTIYKDYRWNFVNEGEDPNISKIGETKKIKKPSIINTILELNSTKTEILESYHTKNHLLEKLKIGKNTLVNIIKNNTLYENKYYIEYHKCPQDLLDKYNKPLNRIIYPNAKKVKQIHPITKNTIVFNSLFEISNKFGICATTIKNAIKDKTVYNGYMWEFVE